MPISIPRTWGQILSLIAFAGLLLLEGCVLGHQPGSGQQQQIVVTVSASVSVPAQIPVSTSTQPSTIQFSASVQGTSNQAVTWSLNPDTSSACSGTSLGAISSVGLYTAATEINGAPCDVVVTATSNEDNVTTGQARVRELIVVTITPATDTIGQGGNLQYSAVVTGAPNTAQGQAVQWSASGGGAFDNPSNNAGLYIAPPLPGGTTSEIATISATSQFDSTQSASATLTIQETDPLGTVSNVQTLSSCPADSNGGLANGTCYSLTVSCDQVADMMTYVKVNAPPKGATLAGTVLFLIGSGGNGLYDSNPTWQYGYLAVENVYAANFNTVQVSFGAPFSSNNPNGWLQGPGGVRRLACRFATVADWVYHNPKTINPNATAANSAPMCGTANSGGSGALAYAVYQYGLAGTNTTGPTQEFNMIEPTSGPPMTRLDQACVCNNQAMGNPDPCTGSVRSPMCFSPSEADIIDPAYQTAGQTSPTLCSQGLTGSNNAQANRFASDSIDYQPNNTIAIPLSKTLLVNMRFGGLDTTTAVPQGETWFGAVAPRPGTPACTQDAPHDLPDVQDGATDIATDIITNCK